MEPEKPDGNCEYKFKLTEVNEEQFEKKVTQFLFRLNEGGGEAIYQIGVEDDGSLTGISEPEMAKSLENLKNIATHAGAEITVIRQSQGDQGLIVEVLARRKPLEELPVSITIAICGNVDAGKSTMLGCLLSGALDDGNGKVREFVMRHPHEINSGRTSSISSKVIGFDTQGTITNYSSPEMPQRTPEELLQISSKLINLVDLAGHERYLKTTIFGIASSSPDYSAMLISSNDGILKMTREHIGLNVVLNIPFFIVYTKIDITPTHIYKKNLDEIKALLKRVGFSRIPLVVKNIDDVSVAAQRLATNRVVPIIPVSFVTHSGVDLLIAFLNLLPVRNQWLAVNEDFLMYIDEIFNIPNVGVVIAGLVQSGTLSTGTPIVFGPDNSGNFYEARIKSIQLRRVAVKHALPGQHITMALAFKDKSLERHLRKGQIITEGKPAVCWSFEAEILILHHPTTLRLNYCSQFHCQSIRQQVAIRKIYASDGREYLRTGDRATVVLEFLYQPEFIKENQQFILREGQSKAYGVIRKLMNKQ